MVKNSFAKIYASTIAPDPAMDVLWMDLAEDSKGSVIKFYDGANYIPISLGNAGELGNVLASITAQIAQAKSEAISTSGEYTDSQIAILNLSGYMTIDASNSNVGKLHFNQSPTAGGLVGGELKWNPTEGSLDLGMNGGDVIQSIGLELYYRVNNKSQIDIVNGDLVSFVGTDGNSGRLNAAKTVAGSEAAHIIGIATENIPHGGVGFVTWFGKVRGISTDGSQVGEVWPTGTVLYPHPSQSGRLTKNEPLIGNKLPIAIVISPHTSNGTMFVRVQRSVSLKDLNDVDVSTATIGQPLVKQSNGTWKSDSSIEVSNINTNGTHLAVSSPSEFRDLMTLQAGLSVDGGDVSAIGSSVNARVFESTEGYIITSLTDDKILLAGGGNKDISDFQLKSQKAQPNGYASLDAAGLVPTTQLPAYVDDVLEFADLSSFPITGEMGKIYVALDTNKTYRWSGSAYIYITSGAVDSVAGKTGVVLLSKDDVGLSNVDNTSDANKPVSAATQIALNTKVSTTGNEAITGIKTFSSPPIVPDGATGKQAVNSDQLVSYVASEIGLPPVEAVAALGIEEDTVTGDVGIGGAPETGQKLKVTGSSKFGSTANAVVISANGHISFTGAATVFNDVTADIARTKTVGTRVTVNDTENTLDMTTLANLTDYGIFDIQMPHSWKVGSKVYPHIHWFQAENNTPNFLIQYRWQINGGAKDNTWKNLKCNTNSFTYVSGILNQISFVSGGVTPPAGAMLSDIMQMRIVRDNANTSTVFSGADPYTATVSVTSVDVHVEMDKVGSNDEYLN